MNIAFVNVCAVFPKKVCVSDNTFSYIYSGYTVVEFFTRCHGHHNRELSK